MMGIGAYLRGWIHATIAFVCAIVLVIAAIGAYVDGGDDE